MPSHSSEPSPALPAACVADLTAALHRLAGCVEANTRLTELLISAMPAAREAELTGKSVKSVYRARAKRRAQSAIQALS